MSQVTVLVGFAEALSAPETVWSLVDAGFRVVAFARKGRRSALRHSRFVVCHEICSPETDLQAALADLQALMASLDTPKNGSRRILFPLDDKAVWLCNRMPLDDGWILAGPRGSNADLALNKCLQSQAAAEAGLNVPKTVAARTANDVFAFAAEEPFPIILRPAECISIREGRMHGGRTSICANRDELDAAVSSWAEAMPLLVQPYIAGTGEGVFGLAAPEGVRAWSGHRRLRMMNPQGSGSSACISQPVSEDLKSKVGELIRRAGWRGLFMIELLRDQSGKVWFVELNGRPWGSMALSRRQGLEYAAWHLSLAIDEKSQVGMALPSASAIVCRNAGREFMHLLFVLKGPKSKALREWPPFWKTLAEVVRVRSADTFYNWRREDPKVFMADSWYTVKDNVFRARN